MTHDPLCGLSQPCDDEVPEHGYCSRQQGEFCIHCMTWCICLQLHNAEQRMLAKCITAVEEIIPDDSDSGSWEATIAAAWLRHAVNKLRALEDK